MPRKLKELPAARILSLYQTGQFSVRHLAKQFGTVSRRIEAICGVECGQNAVTSAVNHQVCFDPEVVVKPLKENSSQMNSQADVHFDQEPEMYEVALRMTESALDFYLASFTPREKAIAIEAVLAARVEEWDRPD